LKAGLRILQPFGRLSDFGSDLVQPAPPGRPVDRPRCLPYHQLMSKPSVFPRDRSGAGPYPEAYLAALAKESGELSRRYREGKVTGYKSAKDLFDGILGR